MNCIVTAGPTYEPLDDVRRLTNFSTGRLGTELANFLAARGHQVTLLIGAQATLRRRAAGAAGRSVHHHGQFAGKTAGVVGQKSERGFSRGGGQRFSFRPDSTAIAARQVDGNQIKKNSHAARARCWWNWCRRKKIIAELRAWFPSAKLVGWKFEADGKRPDAIRAAEQQLTECLTDACVANGPAYGEGFGLITRGSHVHLADPPKLFDALEKLMQA